MAPATDRRAALLQDRARLAALPVKGGAARRFVEIAIARRDRELARLGTLLGEAVNA